MAGNVSNSYPGLAGGIEEVTGELIVDTGLVKVTSFAVTMASTPTAAESSCAGVLEELVPGATQKLKLLVVAADGVTPGASAANVSWVAHQD